MFDKFWKKEKTLITFSGLIATLGALFLNIPTPQIDDAKLALANIQVFWLIILTISLTKLFFSFLIMLIKIEKKMENKYDFPVGMFSVTSAATLLLVVGNFWRYILDLYGKSFFQFITMVFPGVAFMLCSFLVIFVEKNRSKFTRFSYLVVISFIIALLISIEGVCIQQALLGYFYLYWFFPVLQISFMLCLVVFLGIMIIKNKKLFA